VRRVVALLAAALAATAMPSCGGGGAEPGAPQGASLVLDFTPNAAHSGIYAARAQGFYRDAGVELDVRQPGASTDAPKLLEAGRTEFAILDIEDLGIARERGLDLVAVSPIVNAPLASVIAPSEGPVARPRDLQGRTAGVTGLPSDDAVLDSVVAGDGGDPAAVDRVTIGFDAVASLAAGKVDAATGFRNAEAVTLRRRGVPVRIFRVQDYGAPRFPELVLCTSGATLHERPGLVRSVVAATDRGYRFVLARPRAALGDLLDAVPGLDRGDQHAQLRVLLPALSPVGRFDRAILGDWARWARRHGILERSLDVSAAFGAQPP
jgi:NitT/TauT family transport system substrate-binding protein/putative hydroxymethylpyrimidine transport system substrate-binding protein